jgi:hypothetical protein
MGNFLAAGEQPSVGLRLPIFDIKSRPPAGVKKKIGENPILCSLVALIAVSFCNPLS